MAVPVSTTGGGTVTPTQVGWHLVTYQNGDSAVVQWNGSRYLWGSIKPPSSSIVSVQWIGTGITHITDWQTWYHLLASLPDKVANAFIASLDYGSLQSGNPILVSSSGQYRKGNKWTGDVTAINQIPSPISPSAGNTGHLGTPGTIVGNIGNTLRTIVGNIGNTLGSVFGAFGVFATLGFWKGVGLVIGGGLILIFAALELKKAV